VADEIPLDPYFEKFAGPLGHVVLEFNYLEMDAGRLIARLLKQDDVMAGVFGGALSFLDKLKLIKVIAGFKVAEEAIQGEVMAWVKDATKINEFRNRYVHAEYMPMLGPNDELLEMLHRRLKDSARTIDATKGESLDDLLQPVDDEGLKQLAADIHDLGLRTRVLAEKIADSLS